ncbi:MAG: helix-turn-helix transcriptional regulator [Mesorhizobium sp.]
MHDDNIPHNIFRGEGFLRLSQIIAPRGPLPISRSTWFLWVKAGRAPAPIRLGPRVSAYRCSDIEAFIANPSLWGAGK